MYNGKTTYTLDDYMSEIGHLNNILRINRGDLIIDDGFINNIKISVTQKREIEKSIAALKKRYLDLLSRYWTV